jgi:hypothetical protein
VRACARGCEKGLGRSTESRTGFSDLTPAAVALHGFISETIEREVPSELRFLSAYDTARNAMREIVDLPESTANLFVRLCFHNQGRLSATRRSHKAFEKLTGEEIERLEAAVGAAYAGMLTASTPVR